MADMKKAGILTGIFLTAVLFPLLFAGGLYLLDEDVPHDAPTESFTAYLNKRVPKLMERYDIPGISLALVKEGKIVWTQAYGYTDIGTGRKMTANTVMRAQSISKSVTAWGIMKLTEEGKLNLDDPIVRYLKDWKFPESEYPANKVTIRQLLSHTSGLPLGDVFAIYSPEEPKPSLRESLTHSAIHVKEPGSGFSYSNVGYNLLELLIEEVTGRDFSEYMKNEILSPLGMPNAAFVWSESIKPPVPKGYTLNGKAVPVYVYPEKASGGLFATAEDIACFCIAGMPDFSEQDVLTRPGVECLYVPQAEKLGIYALVFDAYGLGYYTERLSGGKTAVSHGGQGTGWMSHFHAVPETGDAIVILTNSQRSWPFIAGVLNDWTRWCGFSAPGMALILLGEGVLWALVGLTLAAIFFLAAEVVRRIAKGGRRFTPPYFKRMNLPRVLRFLYLY